MSESFTLSKAALIRLFDFSMLPNPEDPDSPIGPYTSGISWVLLNPQPLPPVAGPFPDPWRRYSWVFLNPQPLPPVGGPQPDPWRSAFEARMVIDQAVAAFRAAEMSSYDEQSSRALEVARMSINEMVDEYCGNVPRRWPRPWPAPLGTDMRELGPLDLLAAGSLFEKAAQLVPESAIFEEFRMAADRLLETGVSQLEG